jgi:hypothetical protein
MPAVASAQAAAAPCLPAAQPDTVAALDARRDCLRVELEQRTASYEAAHDRAQPLRRPYRRAVREGRVPGGPEADYPRLRAAELEARTAVQEAVRAYREIHRAYGAVRPWRLLLGFDGAVWMDVGVQSSAGPGGARDANFRQPSGVVGVAYEAPVSRLLALRVAARVGLGGSRLSLGSDAPSFRDAVSYGPGYSFLVDAGVRVRTRHVIALGLELQLRVMVPASRAAQIDGQALRVLNDPLVGLVMGTPVEVTLGVGSPWRIEFTPGVGYALGSSPAPLIIRATATLSYAF